MDNDSAEILDAVPGDTPEDVAVLYSWANLQGAKYRDFSASRREYRAALRHRAAEEQRLAEAAAQAEAEEMAAEAEKAAREAEEAARFHEAAAKRASQAHQDQNSAVEEAAKERAMRHAAEMSRIAAAERIEAARRAEAVAAAEAASRREAREMEEARASAQRQAARYHDSELRRRDAAGPQPTHTPIPGQISDPYGDVQQALPGRIFHQPHLEDDDMLPSRHPQTRDARLIVPQIDPAHPHARMEREYITTGDLMQDAAIAARGTAAIAEAADKAGSPVRHMYSEPNSVETATAVDQFARASRRSTPSQSAAPRRRPEIRHITDFSTAEIPVAAPAPVPEPQPELTSDYSLFVPVAQPRARSEESRSRQVPLEDISSQATHRSGSILGLESPERIRPTAQAAPPPRPSTFLGLDTSTVMPAAAPIVPAAAPAPRPGSFLGLESTPPSSLAVPVAPVLPQQPAVASAPALKAAPPPALSPGQRAYAAAKAEAVAKSEAAQAAARRVRGYAPDEASGFFNAYGSARGNAASPAEPAVPAWLTDSSSALAVASPEPSRISDTRKRVASPSGNTPTTPVETLQHSRERVAARWYALKGVFDHGIEEQRIEKEVSKDGKQQAPIVAVFSLAGGVGKTSMVATLGRALSGTGEKVLLTDTTSHGLLPFYFGASELRPGVVRTFSPPTGSADAPIYLVSYDVLQRSGDAASQDWFAGEIATKSAGMNRVILDLSSAAPWVARRAARMDATVLIPLAPDMNSVISLGAMEKFFAGMKDSTGTAVEPYYILNQFDSSLALHLDVREVLRQQLVDRLLPFVIRRAPAVPESLAEGMTVVDYSPESSVAEDYRNLASWLKSRSAPASTENKHARWSER